MGKFKENLVEADWENLYSLCNTNKAYNHFLEIFSSINNSSIFTERYHNWKKNFAQSLKVTIPERHNGDKRYMKIFENSESKTLKK